MSRLPRYRPVKRCAFCSNKANSREHAWPKWLAKRFEDPKRQIIGHIDGVDHYDPTQKSILIRCVCTMCNQGWMKQLEDAAKPLISPMMADLALPLSEADREVLTKWTIKTAMIWEYLRREGQNLYYTDLDREQLRLHGIVPHGAKVHLARFEGPETLQTYGAGGQTAGSDPQGSAFVTTFIVGRLVLQVLMLRAARGVTTSVQANRTRPWSQYLTGIWPPFKGVAHWPPRLHIGRRGAPVGDFHRLWHNPTVKRKV
jgi:hypothetical protein